jgi:peptide/nickel transport system permease protein
MQTYLVRRLVLAVPVLVGVTLLTFILIRVIPGDVVDVKFGTQIRPEQRRELLAQLHLDEPLLVQYGRWMGGVLRGDFGRSLRSNVPVADEFRRRVPVTAELAVLALGISVTIGVVTGVVAATRQDTFLDYLVRLASMLGLSIPGFWLATLVIVLPALWWGVVPPTGFTPLLDDPLDNLKRMFFPALTLGLALCAITMRLMRSSLIEVLRQDYVRVAWSKGLRERTVLGRHALRNALIPVVTVIGLQFSALLGGTVIQETIFVMPGLGRSTVDAIVFRDYPQLQLNVLFIATVYIVMNLLVDLAYSILDPRIRTP